MRVVLASGSARRRELLKLIFEDYEVIASEADEDIGSYPPSELVLCLSELKCSEVYERIVRESDAAKAAEELLVIGSDTVVAVDDMILGKPADREDAYRMLRLLSGREHKVYTGVTLIKRSTDGMVDKRSFYEETAVHVSGMSDEEIHAYIDTGEPMDKAGAYGIQGKGSLFVKGIKGDYFKVYCQ